MNPESLGVAFADVHGSTTHGEMIIVNQAAQLANPDSRIILADQTDSEPLGRFAEAPQGIKRGMMIVTEDDFGSVGEQILHGAFIKVLQTARACCRE